MKKICIIDYKINNISSIKKAVNETGYEFDVIDSGDQFYNYSHVILPGIGSFAAGIKQLKKLNLFDLIVENKNKIYFFGICLGMQLLLEKSEEDNNESRGLGIIKGSVKKIKIKKDLLNIYCPHIGWNNIYSKKKNNLFDIDIKKDFYFANSFYVDPDDKNIIEYSFLHGDEYPAIINKDNIFGVQFHPEKSKEGIKILNNFCNL